MPAPKKSVARKSGKPAAKKVVRAPRTDYSSAAREGLILRPAASSYQPRMGQTAYNNVMGFQSEYQRVHPEMQSLIDMVLDPDGAETGVRWPNTYGLSSTYKSINVINAKYDNPVPGSPELGGNSVVMAYPRLANSIFATKGGAATPSLALVGEAPSVTVMQKVECGPNTHKQQDITNPLYLPGNEALLPIPVHADGTTYFVYKAGPQVTANFANFLISATLSDVSYAVGDFNQFVLKIVNFNAADGVIAGAIDNPFVEGWARRNTGAGINLQPNLYYSAAAVGFALRVQLNTAHSYEGDVNLSIKRDSVGAQNLNVPNIYTLCNVLDLNGADQISTTAEEYIVLAQSLLVSWRGSTLTNGGLIAGSRISSSTNGIGSKVSNATNVNTTGGNYYYSWLSSLQNNTYNGALKHGNYNWYLGDDESDYFYKDVEDQSVDTPFLISAFQTAQATAENTTRIKIVTHLQFKSNSNVYSQAPSALYPDIHMLPHILSLINSSYTNDEHKGGIKENLKKVGKAVGRALVNPKTYHTIAEIMAILSPALGLL